MASDVGLDALIEIDHINAAAPWWPYSRGSTYRLIRDGRLHHVAVGDRRYYVTRRQLGEFVAAHTQRPSHQQGRDRTPDLGTSDEGCEDCAERALFLIAELERVLPLLAAELPAIEDTAGNALRVLGRLHALIAPESVP